jgi:2,3-bisphosphoglycerate-independent phosphoglycerate mutase
MAHKKNKPTALIILDGFGTRPYKEGNAVSMAYMPSFNSWMKEYPSAIIKASGSAVGLLDGMMGNSQVGHMAIGCGRVVQQPIVHIDKAIADGSFFANNNLVNALESIRKTGKRLHIMGLLSDAGIHNYIGHLKAYVNAAITHGVSQIVLHAFLDGRDTPPRSAHIFLQQAQAILAQEKCGVIGSIHGRFYAMDRDNHWDRTRKSYEVLTQNISSVPVSWQDALDLSYAQGVTDEFLVPVQLDPGAAIQDGDGIIFTNIRPDRARQLTACFVKKNFTHFPLQTIQVSFFVTPISYGAGLHTTVLFPYTPVKNTLKDVLSQHEKTIFSVAETEKYAHVTYFFSGGTEKIFPHEVRILVPSIKVSSYAQVPAMSAQGITQSVLKSLKKNPRDFYLINYANADMVGHSGNIPATVKALEILDEELKKLYEVIVHQMNGTMYVTADHGKAEQMLDVQSGQPRTAHTTNPVPFVMLRNDLKHGKSKLSIKKLSDIAALILSNMDISVPEEMK